MVSKRAVHVAIFRSMFHRQERVEEDIPVSWEHLVEHLVREAKHETTAYYGCDGSTDERNYPGFDYADKRIQSRLSRQVYHAKLFHAFNRLGLTVAEIESVATWWGSLYNRTRFEKSAGYKIRDTTEDDIPTEEELVRQQLAEAERRQMKEQEYEASTASQRMTLESILKSASGDGGIEYRAWIQARGSSRMASYSSRRPYSGTIYPNLPYL